MGLLYAIHVVPALLLTLVHGNPIRQYHPCELCATSFFFGKASIGNFLRWVFFQDRCMGFIGLVLYDVLLCRLQVHAPHPYSNYERDYVLALHLRKNFHNLATLPLPHTIMDYDTICWEDNILGSLLLIS